MRNTVFNLALFAFCTLWPFYHSGFGVSLKNVEGEGRELKDGNASDFLFITKVAKVCEQRIVGRVRYGGCQGVSEKRPLKVGQ